MGTVRDYFDIDFPNVLPVDDEVEIELTLPTREAITCRLPFRTYLDYAANATFLSVYIEHPEYAANLADSFLEHAYEVVSKSPDGVLSSGLATDPLLHSRELHFVGRVFLYIDAELQESHSQALLTRGKHRGLAPIIRGREYAAGRTREERPVAFISYDSRDKTLLAKPLAQRLAIYGCPVWFDEISLRIGDSLRESIERGLRECDKCILILSPHFLTNTGWTKTEFNAVFTREIHERNHVILPVWAGVTKDEVYQYSPTLADRYAIDWERGLDAVAQEIRRAIGS